MTIPQTRLYGLTAHHCITPNQSQTQNDANTGTNTCHDAPS